MNQPPPSRAPVRGCRRALAHLTGLWCLLAAHPILQVFANSFEFFSIWRINGLGIVALAVAVAWLPPISIFLALLPFRGLRVRKPSVTMAIACGAVAALGLSPLLRSLEPPLWLVALGACAFGLLTALLYLRASVFANLLDVLAVSALVVPLVFVLTDGLRQQVVTRYVEGVAVPDAKLDAPVFLLLFDELPLDVIVDAEGEIDRRRFPNLARLADDADWFPNALTVSDSTHLAVPAILSGQMPDRVRLPIAREFPYNLCSAFDDQTRPPIEPITNICSVTETSVLGDRPLGYLKTVALVTAHVLLPEPLQRGLPPIDQGWRRSDRVQEVDKEAPLADFMKQAAAATKEDREAAFQLFLDGIGTTQNDSGFYFAHFLLPHLPLTFTPNGGKYSRGEGYPGMVKKVWKEDEGLIALGAQRFAMQTGFADLLIGRFLDHLEQLGLYEKSLIVLVSDHGASFRPGLHRRVLTSKIAPDVLRVPLFFKRPRQDKGRRMADVASVMDIVPTILDLTGNKLPDHLDGRSLYSEDPPTSLTVLSTGKVRSHFDERIFSEPFRFSELKLKYFIHDENPFLASYPPELMGLPLEHLCLRDDAQATVEIEQSDRLGDGKWVRLIGSVATSVDLPALHVLLAFDGLVLQSAPSWRVEPGRFRFQIFAWLDEEQQAKVEPWPYSRGLLRHGSAVPTGVAGCRDDADPNSTTGLGARSKQLKKSSAAAQNPQGSEGTDTVQRSNAREAEDQEVNGSG